MQRKASNQSVLTHKIWSAKRIVIKVGSALLVDNASSDLRTAWLQALVRDITHLQANGTQVILVSSGAIAMGRGALGLDSRPLKLDDAQAAAAVGQVRLAQAYQALFTEQNIVTAQLLLTLDDLEDRPRYLNARATVEALLMRGIVPVINENDTVATSEIRFGDNDRLGARVAQLAGADWLILLSDIDGLYSADPRTNAGAEFHAHISEITPDIEAMAGPPVQEGTGSGGMITKIEAAKIATAAGCSMVILNGTDPAPLTRLKQGERATVFSAKADALTIRKAWIRGMMAPKGIVHIDEGAVKALTDGASLLAAGVKKLDGDFKRGDLIIIKDATGATVGQGLTAYAFDDAIKIVGCNSEVIKDILGYSRGRSLVHRNDMVLL